MRAGHKLYLGVDGGGTKTEAWVVDGEGRLRGRGHGGASNHQESTLDEAVRNVEDAIEKAVRASGLTVHDLTHAAMGLAGADFPEDVAALTDALAPALGRLPFGIVNDAEVALAGGARTGAGVAVVAGTGTNVVGLFRDGERFQIGGLGYELGDEGGGSDLVRHALHYAFRGAEGRGAPTLLSDLALQALGSGDFTDLARGLYFGRIAREEVHLLAPLVFMAARQGDQVAQDLLFANGLKLGESAGAAVQKIETRDGPGVEVVLVGSLWLGPHPLFRDGFMVGLHRKVVEADVHDPELPPPAGAVLMAAAADGGAGCADVIREGLRRGRGQDGR
jgi:N-acetylglucosamine kinase-like BadF-type ATPase